MPIRINARELLEILDGTPGAQNVLLVGRHGIGKSEILTAYFTRRGLTVVPLFLGQMSDPGDLIGLPTRDLAAGADPPKAGGALPMVAGRGAGGPTAGGHTVFMPPYWWPLDGRPVALFLDELNRARPEILQSVHDLALNRTLAGRRLPEGSVVISAVNAGDEYQVSDLDPALASRFNIYEFAPEVEEWIAWARRSGVDRRVVDFIEQSSVHLEQAASSGDVLDKAPDRRAWVRVGKLIEPHASLSPTLVKALAGVVGAQAAMAFHKFLGDKSRLRPEDVLLHLDEKMAGALRALSLQDLVYLNRQILHYLDEQEQKPTPARRKKLVAGVEKYIELMRSGGQTEVVAHFINQTERDEFRRASGLLLASPAMMKIMTDTIERVKL